VSDDGGRTFTAPTAILAGAWVPVSQVKLAAAHGAVWVAWDDRRTEPARIALALLPGVTGAAGVAEVPRHGSTPSEAGAGTSPAIAVAGSHGAIAWLSDGSIRFRAWKEQS
jgi:hypothetical protein